MITCKTSASINKPVNEVFKFIGTDYVTNHPKWDARVVSTKLEPDGPMRQGARGVETRKEAGRTNTFHFEVTDFKPGSSFAFQARGGPAQVSTSYATRALNDKQTQLDIAFTMKMGGIMGLMEPFMSVGVRREFDAITGEIKRMLEA